MKRLQNATGMSGRECVVFSNSSDAECRMAVSCGSGHKKPLMDTKDRMLLAYAGWLP